MVDISPELEAILKEVNNLPPQIVLQMLEPAEKYHLDKVGEHQEKGSSNSKI